jgi:hypothetical protein
MRTNDTLRNAFCAVLLASLPVGCGGEEPRQGTSPQPKAETRAPLIQNVEVADWCKEHAVPESVCTRCNASLIPDFQKKGDWCKEHSLPESQCIECHPELKAKFDAMAPKG